MNSEIFFVDDGAKRQVHEEGQEQLINLAIVLDFAWVRVNLHSVLKL